MSKKWDVINLVWDMYMIKCMANIIKNCLHNIYIYIHIYTRFLIYTLSRDPVPYSSPLSTSTIASLALIRFLKEGSFTNIFWKFIIISTAWISGRRTFKFSSILNAVGMFPFLAGHVIFRRCHPSHPS